MFGLLWEKRSMQESRKYGRKPRRVEGCKNMPKEETGGIVWINLTRRRFFLDLTDFQLCFQSINSVISYISSKKKPRKLSQQERENGIFIPNH